MNKNTLHSLLLNMAVFETLADLGSFSATANKLQMTPSSVSKRIAQLENRLGTKLVERSTRSMRLTHTGELFLKHCQNMLSEANAAVEVANQSKETLAGDVSISVPKSFANHVIRPVLTEFLKTYPDINVRVKVTDRIVDLLRENVDCAIEISKTPTDYLIAKPLGKVRQILCATPQYLQRHSSPINHPHDLKNHECLYLGETSIDKQWHFINHFKDNSNKEIKVEVEGRYTVNHSGMRLDGVMNDLGIGSFPDFVVAKALSEGLVVQVLPEWQLKSKYGGTAWITYLPNKFRPLRLQTFIDFVVDNAFQ